MILTKEELELRLNSEKNITNQLDESVKVQVIKHRGNDGGRLEGAKNLTEDEKVAIGVLTREVGATLTSEIFDVNKSTASRVANRDDVIEKVNAIPSVTEQAAEIAAEKLLSVLSAISMDKMLNASAKDASVIASNLSKVHLNMRGGSASNKSQGPQVMIVLNQPKQAREDHFESIDVQI